jgi:hypothetical protein
MNLHLVEILLLLKALKGIGNGFEGKVRDLLNKLMFFLETQYD